MNEEIPQCKLNITKQCLGSSFFSYMGSTAQCIIKGPYDIRNTDTLNIEVKWKDESLDKTQEKYFADTITSIITKYIIIDQELFNMNKFYVITLLINDNKIIDNTCNLVVALNSIILALCNAGIPINKMFYASTSNELIEEVFLFEDGNLNPVFYHGFGDMKNANTKSAEKNLNLFQDCILKCLHEDMNIEMFE